MLYSGLFRSIFKFIFDCRIIDFASRLQMSFIMTACLIILLSLGIRYIKITTDPVHLWSSPNSQCRQEHEYFNSNFKPFFRTTQVIIVPIGFSDVN